MNIVSLSYGKDSLALFGACEKLGIPVHGAVHAEIWATDDVPADLPPMVEFKKKADAIIKERWGIEVKHICAMWGGQRAHIREPSTESKKREIMSEASMDSQNSVGLSAIQNSKLMHYKGQKKTYEQLFYRTYTKGKRGGKYKDFQSALTEGTTVLPSKQIYGFPMIKGNWCTRELKIQATKEIIPNGEVIQMLGIASDEPIRIERHKDKKGIRLPLVEIGWAEADCRQWCIDNDLLSPIYTDTCLRGGCWFCHNQGVQQLRELRHNYPDLWKLLLKWDSDSPVTFKADGHTVHDFDRRFEAEDKGFVSKDNRFHWEDLNMQQYSFEMYLGGRKNE